jgi:hypothetical protein
MVTKIRSLVIDRVRAGYSEKVLGSGDSYDKCDTGDRISVGTTLLLGAAEFEELAELELGDCSGPFIEYFTLKTFVSKFYHNSAKLRIYPVEPSWMGTLPLGYPFE